MLSLCQQLLNEYSEGFVLPDCYDYIPLLQLCVCYDKLGDRQKAKEYKKYPFLQISYVTLKQLLLFVE